MQFQNMLDTMETCLFFPQDVKNTEKKINHWLKNKGKKQLEGSLEEEKPPNHNSFGKNFQLNPHSWELWGFTQRVLAVHFL